MIKGKYEIFLDTDIFAESIKKRDVSFITHCRTIFDGCYTSVINCSEIFSECRDENEVRKAKGMFDGIGILGIPFRYSVMTGKVLRAIKKKEAETLLGMR